MKSGMLKIHCLGLALGGRARMLITTCKCLQMRRSSVSQISKIFIRVYFLGLLVLYPVTFFEYGSRLQGEDLWCHNCYDSTSGEQPSKSSS